jgi:hypothetical protein
MPAMAAIWPNTNMETALENPEKIINHGFPEFAVYISEN